MKNLYKNHNSRCRKGWQILLMAAIFFGLTLTTARAQDGSECSQETTAGTEVDNGFGNIHLLQVASDVSIDADGTFTLDSIQFNALIEPGNDINGVELHFYEDSGNGPGPEVGSTSMLTPSSTNNIGEFNGFDRIEVGVGLDDPFTFVGEDTEVVYWVGLTIDYAGANSYLEVINSLDTPNETYFFNSDSDSWIAGSDPDDGFDQEADGVISFYGECNDLEVCDGIPEAGTIDAPENVCADTEFSLSVSGQTQASGISYQWQQSSDNGDTWTDIDGETNPVLNLPEGITDATDYRLSVTCDNSDETAESESVALGINPPTECYCEPEFPSSVEPITSVDMTDSNDNTIINNESSNYGDSPAPTAYEDFTDITGEVNAGETYDIAVEGNTDGAYLAKIKVYIDWNQDGEFSNAQGDNESYALSDIENSDGTDGQQATGQIEVPSSALEGATGMRVIKKYNDPADPCNDAGYGQAEDYTINTSSDTGCEWTVNLDGSGSFGDEVSWELREDGDVVLSGGEYEDLSFQDEQSVTVEGPVEFYINTMGEVGDNELDYTVSNENGVLVSEHIDGDQEATHSDLNCADEGEEDPGESGYCQPLLDCSEADMITNVSFETIDNTTTCSPDGYGDYTDMETDVSAGQAYNFEVTVGDGWDVESVSVWIDYDNNETFDDGEFTYIGTGSGETLSKEITIPENTEDGSYRMRVRVAAVGEDDATGDMACNETQGYGETEDYTINVGPLSLDSNQFESFSFYPNPVKGQLNLKANTQIESVALFNLRGQRVLENSPNAPQGELNTQGLSAGVYLMKVNIDGNEKTFRVIKE